MVNTVQDYKEICQHFLVGDRYRHSMLDYMRNVIGIIQAFADKDAVGIKDPQKVRLYAPEHWTERI